MLKSNRQISLNLFEPTVMFISYFNKISQTNAKLSGINPHSLVFNGEFGAQEVKIMTVDVF